MVHLERVKDKSTVRISESIWRSESKCLCLRNGLANFMIIMKNKKTAFNLQQQLFTRSEQELVLWFWYINWVKELLKWNQIVACIIIFLLFSQKKKMISNAKFIYIFYSVGYSLIKSKFLLAKTVRNRAKTMYFDAWRLNLDLVYTRLCLYFKQNG